MVPCGTVLHASFEEIAKAFEQACAALEAEAAADNDAAAACAALAAQNAGSIC
jgi:hypothetical protein